MYVYLYICICVRKHRSNSNSKLLFLLFILRLYTKFNELNNKKRETGLSQAKQTYEFIVLLSFHVSFFARSLTNEKTITFREEKKIKFFF